jgi:hypothetical protein
MGNPSPILKLLSGGMRLVLDTPKDGDKIFVDQQETAVATSLLAVVAKYGKFDQDGDGVWAGYKPASQNDKRHIGVKCSNCIMWKGGSECKLIALPVEPEGKCRFAVIPNDVVKVHVGIKSPQYDDVSPTTMKALEFLDTVTSRVSIKKMQYTKPSLRESIKKRIMDGSRGGRPGQWSARKAQLVAQEYRRAGGGYRGKPAKTQRSLNKWTRERWTTADGKPALRKGKMTRYLPAKAWKRLTPEQRRATIAKKISGDKKGKQFVGNTLRAQNASRSARKG